jgi:hypothetical protein
MPTPSVSPEYPLSFSFGQQQLQHGSTAFAHAAPAYAPVYSGSLPPPFAHMMAPPMPASTPAPNAATYNLFGVAGNVW